MVPEIEDYTKLRLTGEKPFLEYCEAKKLGIETKPVIIGCFTYLKLARYKGKKCAKDFIAEMIEAYQSILERCNGLGVQWVQFDEPALVMDLSKEDMKMFTELYQGILSAKNSVKVILETYFGDIRDCYKDVISLDFDGIGIDFIEGKKSRELVKKYGLPEEKILFAGLINGKNIWKCNYENTLTLISELKQEVSEVVIQPSCSLLHVPYSLEYENKLSNQVKAYFSFAYEKLDELRELCILQEENQENDSVLLQNKQLFKKERLYQDSEVREQVAALDEDDFCREKSRKERRKIQAEKLALPLLPTTTIGSFPQTPEVKKNRTRYRNGEISKSEYDEQVKIFIERCIRFQEDIGLDVLVHGEYERNDMVEFFGENLSGYVFTEKAWVQSYGTRCVKPPIIFGDIKRTKSITKEYSVFAQRLSEKPVKGMLTGPVTILNWSFPREDISLKEMAFQIGIAIREEVMDLEREGIPIIQIDEAALKEKLPLRKEEWYSEYLDWAIPAFRLCQSKVKPETQIHTHMCYSEFEDIIKDIDHMDADVISFEASRSDLTVIHALKENNFDTQVGPGVYDIHSPRIPDADEIRDVIQKLLQEIDCEKLWINPDCGLKTRSETEAVQSLKNLVIAAETIREEL